MLPIRPEWWAVAAAATATLACSMLAARLSGAPAAGRATRWAWLAAVAFPLTLALDDYRVRVIFRAAHGAFDGVRVFALAATTCGLVCIGLRSWWTWTRRPPGLVGLLLRVVPATIAAFAAAFASIG